MVLIEKLKSLFLNFTKFFLSAIVTLFNCNYTKIHRNKKTFAKIPLLFHNKFWYLKFFLPLLRRLKPGEVVRIQIPRLRHPFILRAGTSDVNVFEQIFVNREYDFKMHNVPGLIIDGGANIGLASILFANKFPRAEIIAVEPDLSNFEILKENVRYYKNIRANRSAIWSKNCYLKAEDIGAGKWMIVVKETDNEDPVSFRSVTIDSLLENRNQNSINMLKLDVEGAEKEIFSSDCHNWLIKMDMIIIELHDRLIQGCTKTFNRAIEPYNYKKVRNGENIFLYKS